MPEFRDPALLDSLVDLSSRAGAAIMEHYGACGSRSKADGSPITIADQAADDIICEGLSRLLPGVPILSEESADSFVPREMETFILVDPLDGTKEFLSCNGEFTVNIAIVVMGIPVTGVVLAPAIGRVWMGRVWHGGSQAECMNLVPGNPAAQGSHRRTISVNDRVAGLRQSPAARTAMPRPTPISGDCP